MDTTPTPVNQIRPLAKGSLRVQSDARLVKLFRRGMEPAFDELVRRYRAKLVGYAGAIAGNDRAEDVVQESLVKAHRSFAGSQQIEPKPWLYTIVRNAALNDIRDNRKHSHDGLGETVGHASAHDIVERREEFAAVVAAVSDLPDAQRRALIGHELGGFTHEELAAELDLSTGATKQLIYRARLTLRNGFGALIPFPVIAWLVSHSAGVVAGGTATGAAGAGAVSAASGGTAAGTGSSGILTAISGAGTTKLAVAAVVAGGSLTAGIAVERQFERAPVSPAKAAAAEAGETGSNGSSGSGGSSPALEAAGTNDAAGSSNDGSADDRKGGRQAGDDPPGTGGSRGEDSGGRSGGGGHQRHPREDDSSGGHHEPGENEGSGGSHPGSGDTRPYGEDDSGDDGDEYRPPRPAGNDDSGSSGGSHGDYSSEYEAPESPEPPEPPEAEEGDDDPDHSGPVS